MISQHHSSDGSVPSASKLFPEPSFTKLFDAIWVKSDLTACLIVVQDSVTTKFLNQSTTFLFENVVCKLSATLFRPQRAKCSVGIKERYDTVNTQVINTLRPRQDGHHFEDDIFKFIFLYENWFILLEFHWDLFPMFQSISKLVLVQIMAWHRAGDKPLYKPRWHSLLTHICLTRCRRVKTQSVCHSMHNCTERYVCKQTTPKL